MTDEYSCNVVIITDEIDRAAQAAGARVANTAAPTAAATAPGAAGPSSG